MWETDGLRRLETRWTGKLIQFTFSVKPQVSPVLFVSRVKGRLQHALRTANCPTKFSRKVAFRTVGDNRRTEVEAYIKNQVDQAKFVDSQFATFLGRFTSTDPDVHLELPSETNSGRYWYNLHLVLVVDQRERLNDENSLKMIDEWSTAIALKKGYAISARSVMPDHLHLAMRGNIEHCPEDIALAMMNNLAFPFGQSPIWRPSYYAGTFGEYDMDAVRRRG